MVLALAAGIFWASALTFPTLVLTYAMVLALGLAWLSFLLFRRMTLSLVMLLAASSLAGALLFTKHNQDYEINGLHTLQVSGYADFTGTMNKSPSPGLERDVLLLRVESLGTQGKVRPVSGNLRVSLPHDSEFSLPEKLHVGDRIRVAGRLSSSRGFRNFNAPSLEMYWKSRGIHAKAFAKSPLLVERLRRGPQYSPRRLISIFRQKWQEIIEAQFGLPGTKALSTQGAVLEALLLGERGRMPPELTRSLQDAGIYHLFAISGAHIAIISFLMFSVFRVIQIPKRLSYVFLIVFLILYAFLVEGRPSIVRATVMALSFLIGKLFWKDINLLNTLALSALVLLLFNPFHLFTLGFQLTFLATLAILVFFPKIIRYLPRLPLRISEIFALSVAAQLGVLPLVAQAFHRITFSSLILNFAALPLVALIMAGGYVFLTLSLLSPVAGPFLSQALARLIDLFTFLPHLLEGTFLSFRVPKPHAMAVLGYYGLLLLLLLPWGRKWPKIIFLAGFLTVAGVLVSHPFPRYSPGLKFTFIDVGQGESTLIEFPGRKTMLVDGGGLYGQSFDIGENVVSPVLWRKGIKVIDFMVLTHAHPDHMKGLISVAQNFRIGAFWEAFSPHDSKEYDSLMKALPASASRRRIFKDDSIMIGRVRVDVLHPQRGDLLVSSFDNDQSIVLRLSYGDTSFLLTGDIGSGPERAILAQGSRLKSQLLKSPHHGSLSSSSEEFLGRAAPRIVVISVGEGNRYGVPDHEVLARYEKLGARVFRTDLHGAVEVSSDGRRLFLRTVSGERFQVQVQPNR